MLLRPHTLSLITTHQCTAACDHCCFSCSPTKTKRIPFDRLVSLIDQARDIGSIRVVVFTGGECFLLGDELYQLIARATSYGLITRCVTNGYWAASRQVAGRYVARLVRAGLKEINFSTGLFHSKYVPVERIVHGAAATIDAGLTTIINAEIFNESNFNIDLILKNPHLEQAIAGKKLTVNRNVWIESSGTTHLTHQPEHSRFDSNRENGCSTSLMVLGVTPDQSLVTCCGLNLEQIPELHLGSVANTSLSQLIQDTSDDFLKMWIHVQGPERILQFVKRHLPDYELPVKAVHPCETCLHLYKDKAARRAIRDHYREIESEVTAMYLAGVVSATLGKKIDDAVCTLAD